MPQLLFGTDYPMSATSLTTPQALRETGVFTESEARIIERDNPLKLFPRPAQGSRPPQFCRNGSSLPPSGHDGRGFGMKTCDAGHCS